MGDNEEIVEREDSHEALTALETADDEEELTPIRERREPEIEVRVATLRERLAALLIDSFILFYVYWVYLAVYGRIFLGDWDANIPLTNMHAIWFNGSFLLICFLYYITSEGIFLATIGKALCRMSVRKKNSEPASLISVFFRNLVRIVDYVLIFPVIFMMEKTNYHQRLGDLISGTTVVKKDHKDDLPYKDALEKNASASGRTIAMFIDVVLFAAFIAGYLLLLDPDAPFLSRILLILLPLVAILYFVIIEMPTETTAGKWIFGYKTCHDDGRKISTAGSIVRTCLLPLDITPVGVVTMFISTRRQRFGDLAAGTFVIKEKRSGRGAIAIAIAIVLAGAAIYAGLMNKNNFLSGKFNFNFLPKVELLKNAGLVTADKTDLKIGNFRFAANEPHEYRVPATFSAGETVFLVFELNGYAKDDRNVWLQEDLSVKYPNGTIGLNQENIVDYKQVVKGDAPIEFTNNITLPMNAEAGVYYVTVKIRDQLGHTATEEVKDFFVRRNIYINPE